MSSNVSGKFETWLQVNAITTKISCAALFMFPRYGVGRHADSVLSVSVQLIMSVTATDLLCKNCWLDFHQTLQECSVTSPVVQFVRIFCVRILFAELQILSLTADNVLCSRARHFFISFVLVQPRKGPCITLKLLRGTLSIN